MTIHVRPATLADAHRLTALAASTFRETFEHANTPEDMARYIADAASTVLLAERRDAHGDVELVGYAHLRALGADAQTDALLARPVDR